MTTIEGGWQGSAADGAQGAARPLADNAAEGAEYLYLAQDLLDRQTGSFHRAAASVEPIPPQPSAEMLEQVVPFDVDTEAQTREYQQKAQHNIRVFEGYDNASNHNETYLPQQFNSTNHSGGGISVTPADTLEVDDSPRSGGPGSGPGNYSAPSGDYVRNQVPTGTPVPGFETAPNDFRPAPGNQPGSHPTAPAAHQPPVTGAPPPFVPTGGYPGGPGGSTRGGPGGSGVRGGVPGEAGGRSGHGGAFGDGPVGPVGPGGGHGNAGGPGAVRGPALGPGGGALAEEAAARRAAAAAAGRGGAGMMGGAPMGAGRKDEDEEHTRKVLIEADPESTFGSEELTAPQVIGDDEYED